MIFSHRSLTHPARAIWALMLVAWNARLYVPVERAGAASTEVEAQLRFLHRALDEGAASRAQRLFPEGFVFSWALYGLTQAERGLALPAVAPARAEALAEARRALAILDSDEAKESFDPDLVPRYGAFYAGWTTWLRAKVVRLAGANATHAEKRHLDTDVERLVVALDQPRIPFLDSYAGRAWPGDSVVCLAALREAALDEAIGNGSDPFIKRWLAETRPWRDPRTGLLPHEIDTSTGRVVQGPRGTSAALMAAMLPLLDEEVGHAHYELFRRHFVVSRLGLPGVRELLPETPGAADEDSGPLLLGVSLSASAVAIAAARANGDATLADALARTADFVGATPSRPGEKQYLLGALPLADAFIVWSKATPMSATRAVASAASFPRPGWRLGVHAICALLALWPWRRAFRGWPPHV
jgi:hypothetical protein